ncbi:E3 ubiquitin-protein ligase [Symbiodinium microadriaticum]|uniref:E3 ubiquitin-protein ligase n=1 Tax=Symbiodinium microadriaticum TaxID=2951 RepID=A0A1Q9E9F1_SYMMI|nr:E3 ubiquitin-protein ligase [Symbiodinium microadriaticum]CAE7269246.1 RNF149 [Symbiodinium sp. KB8]
MRALPVPDPDEYDRYVFGNEYEFEPALITYDEDLFFQQSWTGSYPKCVVAANTVSHTFCSRADRAGPADRHGRCVICLENFKDGDCIRSLRCFHPFHQSCVDKWLEGSRLCPICKQDITGSPWTLATEAAASSDSGFTSSDFFADEPGHTPPTPRLRRSAAEVSAPAQHRRPLPAESAHSTRPRLVQPVLRFESGRSALSALYASTASVLQRLHHDRVSQVLHGTAYSAPSTDSRARCQVPTSCDHIREEGLSAAMDGITPFALPRRLRRDPDASDIHVFHPEVPLPSSDEEDSDVEASAGCSELEISKHTLCHIVTHPGGGPGPDQGPREETCAVCLEDFRDGDLVRVLRCFHTFHRDCVDTWLARNHLCPICKQDVAGQPTGKERKYIACCLASEVQPVTSVVDFPSLVHEVPEHSSARLSFRTIHRLYNASGSAVSPLTRSAATVPLCPHDVVQPLRSGRTRRVRQSPCIIAL